MDKGAVVEKVLVQFIKNFKEADDKEKLNLLENNLQLKMVVMLGEDETTVVCDTDDEIFLHFDYCQGNDFIVQENLKRLHIRYEIAD